jgi:DNA-binding transcriptional regulator YiaG
MTGRSKSKPNQKGRTNKPRFLILDHGMIDTTAFLHLSGDALKLLIFVWRRHNGNNNGRISFSIREAMQIVPCSTDKARRLFAELQDKGFLVCELNSNFDWKAKRAREWRITKEQTKDHVPTRDFNLWRPDKQKPVTKTGTARTDNRNQKQTSPDDVAPTGTDSRYQSPTAGEGHGTGDRCTYNTTPGAQPASGHTASIIPLHGNTTPADSFGARIKRERQAQGLSVKALADASGIGRSTLSNIEAGRYQAGERARVELMKALNGKGARASGGDQ